MPEAFLLRPAGLAAAAIAAALAGTATAQPEPGPWQAVVSRQVHLRAGPGPSYPVVAVLIPGTPVEVRGCLPNYAWCDVEVDVRRGAASMRFRPHQRAMKTASTVLTCCMLRIDTHSSIPWMSDPLGP